MLLLISGGEENRQPYLKEVIPYVMKQGVTLSSLSLGTYPYFGLREVAVGTSGYSYCVSDSKKDRIIATELVLMESFAAHLAEEKKPVLVSFSFSGLRRSNRIFKSR